MAQYDDLPSGYSAANPSTVAAQYDDLPSSFAAANPSYYQRNVKPFAMEVAKGVPIAGSYVPQTPGMSDFEQRHPWVAKGANIGGGVLGTGAVAAVAPEAFGLEAVPWLAKAPSLLGWGSRTAAGSASNAVLSRGDALARGKSQEQADAEGRIGALTGLAPALLGKVAAPGLSQEAANILTEAPAIAGGAYGFLHGGYEPGVYAFLMGEGATRALKDTAMKALTRTEAPQIFGSATPAMSRGLAQAATPSPEQAQSIENSPMYRQMAQSLLGWAQ